FSQSILLASKSCIRPRHDSAPRSVVRALFDFRYKQRKHRFILSSGPRGVAERLMRDGVEERLEEYGILAGAGDRLGFERIQNGQRLPGILQHENKDERTPRGPWV